jgi:acetyltransferase-like isoleucine patch superfamily enzyme
MGDYEERGGALIHKWANLVGQVEIGKGTRIDAFVTITGPAKIGRYCHISVGVAIFGGGGIEIGDYCGISPGVKIHTASDDMSGEWIMNPTAPLKYRNAAPTPIRIGSHCNVGANSVLLPGAGLEDGACLGALSLCKSRLLGWAIYAGVPARFIRGRTQGALDKAREFECSLST